MIYVNAETEVQIDINDHWYEIKDWLENEPSKVQQLLSIATLPTSSETDAVDGESLVWQKIPRKSLRALFRCISLREEYLKYIQVKYEGDKIIGLCATDRVVLFLYSFIDIQDFLVKYENLNSLLISPFIFNQEDNEIKIAIKDDNFYYSTYENAYKLKLPNSENPKYPAVNTIIKPDIFNVQEVSDIWHSFKLCEDNYLFEEVKFTKSHINSFYNFYQSCSFWQNNANSPLHIKQDNNLILIMPER